MLLPVFLVFCKFIKTNPQDSVKFALRILFCNRKEFVADSLRVFHCCEAQYILRYKKHGAVYDIALGIGFFTHYLVLALSFFMFSTLL